MIPNYHVLIVSTLPATNTSPARVKIKSERFRQTVIIGFTNDHSSGSPTIETAVTYLENKGFEVMGKGEAANGYYLITNTFEPIK